MGAQSKFGFITQRAFAGILTYFDHKMLYNLQTSWIWIMDHVQAVCSAYEAANSQ
jgi:hypothetical protein